MSSLRKKDSLIEKPVQNTWQQGRIMKGSGDDYHGNKSKPFADNRPVCDNRCNTRHTIVR